jgi:hypothetical protein
MLPHRKVLLVLAIVLVLGSTAATLQFAARLRSDAYRASVEADLTEQIGVDVTIETVEPHSLESRIFHQVRAQLPNGGQEIFHCQRALWAEQPNTKPQRYALQLTDGWLRIGSKGWERDLGGPDARARVATSPSWDCPRFVSRRSIWSSWTLPCRSALAIQPA